MSDVIRDEQKVGQAARKPSDGSAMNPVTVEPLSKADPSVEPEWNEHVQEYFNQDAHPGEAIPTASHEAKE
ncbi:hypothetical protein JNW90_21065 [Micromonospora sp. STR1s_5]|nr:hypothetical protein [Micromonospora sp. STR1s_5]